MPKIARTALGMGAFGLGVLGCGGSVNDPSEGLNQTDAGNTLPDAAHSYSCSRNGDPIRVSNVDSAQFFPTVISAKNNYSYAWSDIRNGDWEIFSKGFALSVNDQNNFSETRMTDSKSAGLLVSPALAFDGENVDLLAIGQSAYYFMKMTPAGTKIGTEKKVADADEYAYMSFGSPALARLNNSLGMVWNGYFGEGSSEVYFKQLSINGDPQGASLRLTNDNIDSYIAPRSSIVGTLDEYAVSWYDEKGIYLKRINKQNGPIEPATIIAKGNHLLFTDSGPTIAWSGQNIFTAWSNFTSDPETSAKNVLSLTKLSKEGKIESSIQVTDGNSLDLFPFIVWDSNRNEIAMAWTSNQWQGATQTWATSIKFARINSNGEKIGPDIIVSNASGEVTTYGAPNVASSEFGYALSYAQNDSKGDKKAFFQYINCSIEK